MFKTECVHLRIALNLGTIPVLQMRNAFLQPLPAFAFLLLPHRLCLGSLESFAFGFVSMTLKTALKVIQRLWPGSSKSQELAFQAVTHMPAWWYKAGTCRSLTCSCAPLCLSVVSAWNPAFCSLTFRQGRQWKWGVRLGGGGEGGRSEEAGSTAWPNRSFGESEEKAGVSKGGLAQPHELNAITY